MTSRRKGGALWGPPSLGSGSSTLARTRTCTRAASPGLRPGISSPGEGDHKARELACRHSAVAAYAVATPAGVIILQGRVDKRLLCGMLTLWKRLVDEILWAPGGKRFREHSLTCAAAAAMQA
eukprot:scaffold11300_cov66-Phaeocystis_antarctica.AAC.3